MALNLDDTDLKILDLLQRDARLTNAAIAEKVGLTAPSVFERIRKLEQRGVIRGYRVEVDPVAVGKSLTAIIRLTAAFDDRYERGVQALRQDPDILELYNVAGEDCFVVKTRVAAPEDLEALLHRIRGHLTIQRSVTMIALSALKENGPLNLLNATSATPAKSKNGARAQTH